ncbi:helix-turn-helix domain-containing protein [Marinobacter sp. M1N3S26]|uniref:helix-turn-helix domain-containing protein n=1 Tax=Marinobacter sp. M1N3S26 TaxID=3382299 RepID=UPI00387AB24D
MDFNARVIPLHLHPLGFIEIFVRHGASLSDLLKGTGISPAMFDMQDIRISYLQQQTLVRNGIQHCRKPGLGLITGMEMDWSFWGTLGYTIHSSPSLKEAGEAFRRYLVIAQPYYALMVSRPTTYIDCNRRVVDPLDYATDEVYEEDVRMFTLEFRVAMAARLWTLCGNPDARDTDVHVTLDYPEPAHVDLYSELPCKSVTFGTDRTAISADYNYVIKPFRPYRRRAYRKLIQQCEQELNQAPVDITFTDRVRWHIRSHFNPSIDLEQVAQGMQMPPRSLTRRLAAEKTSFRKLLHSVRMEIATHQLRSSGLSVDEVADIVGFSCASSLRRAMKKWSGTTISHIREQQGVEELMP